jgi:hypothetical protein
VIFARGLGKTVECLAGCVLRSAATGAGGKSLIVTPNDAVSEQWRQHLIKGGIPEAQICMVKATRVKLKAFNILTRYKVCVSLSSTYRAHDH